MKEIRTICHFCRDVIPKPDPRKKFCSNECYNSAKQLRKIHKKKGLSTVAEPLNVGDHTYRRNGKIYKFTP